MNAIFGMRPVLAGGCLFTLAVLLAGCQSSNNPGAVQTSNDISSVSAPFSANLNHPVQYTEDRDACADYSILRKPFYGDLHVHSALSFDAVAGRIDTMPEDAFDFAKGKRISFYPQNEEGEPVGSTQIERPLDFLAVTDHSELLGERALCVNPDSSEYEGKFCQNYREFEFRGSMMLATAISLKDPSRIEMLCGADGKRCLDAARGPWKQAIGAAEDAYDRSEACTFSSFVGYEHTGSWDQSSYHRNVIFRNGNVPELPVSYMEAPLDYMIWDQLNAQCGDTNNCDYISIPHNSNMSNGKLLTPYVGQEQTTKNKVRYAQTRLSREPIMEIFQHKGASECVNGLSSVLGAVDELCDIEQVRVLGQTTRGIDFHLEGEELVIDEPENAVTVECEGELGSLGLFGGGCISHNDFLRTALLTGMQEQQEIGLNPIKMGVIASTDGHTGVPGSVEEDAWKGTVTGEMTILGRLEAGTLPSGIKGNPGGLAGVWAVENSRDAIFNAMQLRETFGTSGPRIAPRFFGGWALAANSCSRPDMIEYAYGNGVPMGGDLPAAPSSGKNPTFILAAQSDAGGRSSPLQQLQIVKGWIDAEGQQRYKVHTVAGSADNGAGVDTSTGERHGDGHASLCAVFEDREFDPEIPSYYYLRAVENPSPRWSLLDCLKLAEADRPAVCQDASKQVIQEMAWSSPVWYTPQQTIFQLKEVRGE